VELFTYFRSTASYRVRLVMAHKGIPYVPHYVNLRINEQNQDYKNINPFGLVPTLSTAQGIIPQSLAIIEYLEKLHPAPALWLADPFQQAQAMAIAQVICCDIHPLNNLRVLKYLTDTLGITEEQKSTWYHHWVHEGFKPLEKQLSKTSGKFCVKDQLSIADICLIPQAYNANRFGVDLSSYPTIHRINEAVLDLQWTKLATPEAQEDANC
jgi:maleylacetoacetate isomerase